jgi:hypothetical protein
MFRYLKDGLETNEEELYVGDEDKTWSFKNHSTLSDLDL